MGIAFDNHCTARKVIRFSSSLVSCRSCHGVKTNDCQGNLESMPFLFFSVEFLAFVLTAL